MPPVYSTQRLQSDLASAATAAALRQAVGAAPGMSRGSLFGGNLVRDPAGPITLRSSFVHGASGAPVLGDNPDGNKFNGFPCMGVLPASHPLGPRIYIAYAHLLSHGLGGTSPSIDIQHSDDGGLTWSTAVTVLTPTNTAFDPAHVASDGCGASWLYYHAPTATFLMGIDTVDADTGGLHYTIRSTDGGVTWTTQIVLASDPLLVDHCNGGSAPVLLSDGSLVMAVYGKLSGESLYNSNLIRSTDGGTTWAHRATIGDGTIGTHKYEEPGLVLMDNGTLLCTMRTDDDPATAEATTGARLWMSTSTDNGITWTTPAVMVMRDGGTVYGHGRPRVIQLSALRSTAPPAAASVPPLVLMTRQDYDQPSFYPFDPNTVISPPVMAQRAVYMTSWDRGATWESPSPLDDNLLDFAYGDFAEVQPGLVATCYAVELWTTAGNAGFCEPRFTYLIDGTIARTPLGGSVVKALTAETASFGGRSLVVPDPTIVPPGFTAGTNPTRAEYNALISYLGSTGRLPMVPKNLAAIGWYGARWIANTQDDLTSTWTADNNLLRNDGVVGVSDVAPTVTGGVWGVSSGVLSNGTPGGNNLITWNTGKFFVTYQCDVYLAAAVEFMIGSNAAGSTGLLIAIQASNSGTFIVKKKVAGSYTTLQSFSHARNASVYSTFVMTATFEPDPANLQTHNCYISGWLLAQGGTPTAANRICKLKVSTTDLALVTAGTYVGILSASTSSLFTSMLVKRGMAAGDPIYQLTDQSGTGNHLTAATTAKGLQYAPFQGFAKELPYLLVNGSWQLVSQTFADIGMPFVVCGVFIMDAITGQTSFTLAGAATGSGSISFICASQKFSLYSGSGSGILSPAIVFPFGPAVLTAVFDPVRGSQFRVNGNVVASGDTGIASPQFTQIGLGSTNNGHQLCGELAVLAGRPSESNLRALERYMGNVYGVAVA